MREWFVKRKKVVYLSIGVVLAVLIVISFYGRDFVGYSFKMYSDKGMEKNLIEEVELVRKKTLPVPTWVEADDEVLDWEEKELNQDLPSEVVGIEPSL